MTPSEKAKSLGCKSLGEVSRVSGLSKQTLINWSRNRPFVYEAVCEKVARERYQAQADEAWPNLNVTVK